jgi:hypothetical protein
MTTARAPSPLLELGGRTIVVHVFPDDVRLLEDVRRAALAMHLERPGEDDLRHAVEVALRPWYPRLTITCRQELARLSESEHVWYVLRDGRVRPPEERRDRLYSALAAARETSERSDQALRDAHAAISTALRPRPVRSRGSEAVRAGAGSDPLDALPELRE